MAHGWLLAAVAAGTLIEIVGTVSRALDRTSRITDSRGSVSTGCRRERFVEHPRLARLVVSIALRKPSTSFRPHQEIS